MKQFSSYFIFRPLALPYVPFGIWRYLVFAKSLEV